MALDTFSSRSTQAMASWAIEIPRPSAIGRSRCTASSTWSCMKGCMNPASGPVAREPSGTSSPGWYLPVSTPCPIGDHTIWPMPSCLESGITSGSIAR